MGKATAIEKDLKEVYGSTPKVSKTIWVMSSIPWQLKFVYKNKYKYILPYTSQAEKGNYWNVFKCHVHLLSFS